MRAVRHALWGLTLTAAWMGCGDVHVPLESGFGKDVVAEAYGEVLTWDSLASWVPDDLNLKTVRPSPSGSSTGGCGSRSW